MNNTFGNTKILALAAMLLCTGIADAQHRTVAVAKDLYSETPNILTRQIVSSLDSLLSSIDRGKLDTTLVDRENYDFNCNFFTYLRGLERKDTVKYYFQGQLINFYPIARSQYALTLAFLHDEEIGKIFTFLAREDAGKIVFANPIKYNTRGWKTSVVGTITFHYPDTFNVSRAEKLHQKNVSMAEKLKLPVYNWEMYMCRNYQEILQLQGCSYSVKRNGVVNLGDIVDPQTFFSVMNDEDFSHDVLHAYAAIIRGNDMNVTECGLAYHWGNAYYAGNDGNIPEQQDLIPVLRQYITAHRDVKLLDLFEKNPDVLAEYGYPQPIYVRHIIAGLIWAEIERQKGTDGVIAFLKCGRGYDNLFKSTEALIGINRENFDEKVYRLLFAQSDYSEIRISEDVELIKLSEKAYVHVSVTDIGGFGKVSSNGLILIDKGEAFLFDTPVTNSQTETLVKWIADSLKASVSTFIPNHWHEDCLGGLDYLHSAGVKSYANQMTIDLAKEHKIAVPQNGFIDSLRLNLHGKDIFCYYPGAGHSTDNIVIWIPSEKILFGGCMVKDSYSNNLGNLSDAKVEEWPETIQKVIDRFPETNIVIPGHGRIGGKELLSHTKELLQQH
jgi:metallo-beta-lactamase class B